MSVLFSLCWLGEPWRIKRYQKWLDYHLSIQSKLGFSEIVLVDNASSFEDLRKLGGTIFNAETLEEIENIDDRPIYIYRYSEHLPRTGIWEYPYCWRGLDFVKKNLLYYWMKKIIFLDSDFYILTSKLSDYIRDLDSGWVSFFCHKYGFPEAAINVLCADSIQKLLDFPISSYTQYNGQHMEWLLPFTQVHKTGFVGDRYGEAGLPQLPEYDYYGQVGADIPDFVFDMKPG